MNLGPYRTQLEWSDHQRGGRVEMPQRPAPARPLLIDEHVRDARGLRVGGGHPLVDRPQHRQLEVDSRSRHRALLRTPKRHGEDTLQRPCRTWFDESAEPGMLVSDNYAAGRSELYR